MDFSFEEDEGEESEEGEDLFADTELGPIELETAMEPQHQEAEV